LAPMLLLANAPKLYKRDDTVLNRGLLSFGWYLLVVSFAEGKYKIAHCTDRGVK